MKPNVIFSFLRIATSILYYLMIVLTVMLIGKGIMSISGNLKGRTDAQFSHEVMAFSRDQKKPDSFTFDGNGPLDFEIGPNGRPAGTKASTDSLIRYIPIVNRYRLEVRADSVLGYYSFSVAVLNFLLVIAIMGLFRRIFSEVSVAEPFKPSIFKHLIRLAILFVVSDVLKIGHYLIFNQLINRNIPQADFDLVIQIGNGFITGLIIYAIAVIYQRGLSIQEENTLTV
ncbi:DUF2975 domain-containing protein [Larkinella bovis]|uniref:DUF2975 domain-containing protein n=1 Tax=Larkinella bovis TaxID=683041 RepID=A0ABW0I4H7_9BACT